VFIQELNKADADGISYKSIASMLSPFLQALGTCKNRTLTQRVIEKVFEPLRSDENETDDSSSEINYDPQKGTKWVDGGKLPPKTQKEIQKMLDQRFHFANFNILLYS
jgi:hypothetical protein